MKFAAPSKLWCSVLFELLEQLEKNLSLVFSGGTEMVSYHIPLKSHVFALFKLNVSFSRCVSAVNVFVCLRSVGLGCCLLTPTVSGTGTEGRTWGKPGYCLEPFIYLIPNNFSIWKFVPKDLKQTSLNLLA